MKKEDISKIYNVCINTVLNGVDGDIKNEIAVGYYNYLMNTYSDFDISNITVSVSQALDLLIDLENSKWNNATVSIKKLEFIKDSALDNIKRISGIAHKYATKKINITDINGNLVSNTLDEETADKNIELLNNYLLQVKDFNKELANIYVSDGILDFEFACGRTNYVSLETGRQIY